MDNIKKLIKKEKNVRKKLIILYILIIYSWNDATEQIIKRIKAKKEIFLKSWKNISK